MIAIKNEAQIEIMKKSGAILAEIMAELKESVEVGMKTQELEEKAQVLVKKRGVECSFKGYRDYPACLCTSLNEEIVHVPPSGKKIGEGDLFSLDMGIKFKSYHADLAFTVGLKEVPPQASELMEVTREALQESMERVKPGNTLGDVGHIIQRKAEQSGFSVIKELCGHGIGRDIHQAPQVLNVGEPGKGLELEPGMTLCLEPMIAMGKGEVVRTENGHGFKTKDNSLSAHFEHTVLVTEQGYEVLTTAD
ncbi:methionine aminopeptidase [candidate division MSBL1 archaeon SCGC-AAA382N08]|uniref:Methionine aminopeptidase n=1 Tax=candidate division MSBL1 archaeon SCGC-AAA382N08 TaxID=1698285 RepID=A0A133VQX9_9EURY|nr:methionine aminopeptidase [candidate division MSBL1 archaeon SCGC-AAA382N08]